MSVTPVPDADGPSIRDALGDARSVLLLAPPGDEHAEDACTSMLAVAPPADEHLLAVTLDETPDEWLAGWRATVGDLPARTGIIVAGEGTRSAAATAAPSGPGPTPVSIDTVAEVGDLTGLAMVISAYLDAWSEARATPVVCFHSVSALLHHADLARVFRFLHATTGRLRQVGAVAHYHLDPTGVDEATVNTLAALFDAVVEVDSDGTVSVRMR